MPSIGRLRYSETLPPPGARARGVVVFLHAFPLNSTMWEGQQTLALGGWRVIAPDFRGMHGGENDPPAASVDDYAADVVDLLDALHVDDAIVAGLSLGGYVAFALLRLAPTYVRGLVLADTRAEADTPEGVDGRKRMLALLHEKGAGAIADDMLPKLLSPATHGNRPEVVARVRQMILGNTVQGIGGAIGALMTRPDSTPLLASIRCPTLVIVGSEDAATPPSASEKMHRAIGGSELVIVPAAAHLSNIEQPDTFNGALAAFLENRV
jgi:3-oxoadipate enol-lactonase